MTPFCDNRNLTRGLWEQPTSLPDRITPPRKQGRVKSGAPKLNPVHPPWLGGYFLRTKVTPSLVLCSYFPVICAFDPVVLPYSIFQWIKTALYFLSCHTGLGWNSYPLYSLEQNYLNPLRVIFFFIICITEIIAFPNKAVGIIKWNVISERLNQMLNP